MRNRQSVNEKIQDFFRALAVIEKLSEEGYAGGGFRSISPLTHPGGREREK